MAEPSYNKLTSAHFHAWSLGLKTGQYYLRSRPSRDAIKFTLNVESLIKNNDTGNLFEHMNVKNLTQVEMDQNKRKKRKINEISTNENEGGKIASKEEPEFKIPPPKKTAQEIKECAFNPFGDDSCDMCGS